MNPKERTVIEIKATVNAPIQVIWECWTLPEHIKKWNNASPDWHTPKAENDLRAGGKFLSRMEARDGSFGFDFQGVYDAVKKFELISYTLGDNRKVKVDFKLSENQTIITESFEAEDANPVELQRSGWQSILNNFKLYAESVSR